MKTCKSTPFNLDEIRIAAPCDADWDKMIGDDRARFCALCKKNVYDLSVLSRPQAEALIREKEGNLCVQIYRRADGTVLTDNCPVGLRAIRNRFRWATVATAAAFVTIGVFVGMRSAKAAGVSIREVQPFKALQNAQPVKALVDWLDPMLAVPPPRVMGTPKAPRMAGVVVLPAQRKPAPTPTSTDDKDCNIGPEPLPTPKPAVQGYRGTLRSPFSPAIAPPPAAKEKVESEF